MVGTKANGEPPWPATASAEGLLGASVAEWRPPRTEPFVLTAHWYVAETLPQREFAALEALKRHGFNDDELFLPTYARRAHRQGSPTLLSPLIARVVFIYTALNSQVWATINQAFGVRGILQMDHRPAPVRAEVMALFRESVAEERHGVSVLDPVKVGARLRLAISTPEGPLEGLCVARQGDRLKVMAFIFGCSQEIRTSMGQVLGVV